MLDMSKIIPPVVADNEVAVNGVTFKVTDEIALKVLMLIGGADTAAGASKVSAPKEQKETVSKASKSTATKTSKKSTTSKKSAVTDPVADVVSRLPKVIAKAVIEAQYAELREAGIDTSKYADPQPIPVVYTVNNDNHTVTWTREDGKRIGKLTGKIMATTLKAYGFQWDASLKGWRLTKEA